MTPTWEARNVFGALVRTFGSRDLAEAYVTRMSAIGSVVTITRSVVSRRKAA